MYNYVLEVQKHAYHVKGQVRKYKCNYDKPLNSRDVVEKGPAVHVH